MKPVTGIFATSVIATTGSEEGPMLPYTFSCENKLIDQIPYGMSIISEEGRYKRPHLCKCEKWDVAFTGNCCQEQKGTIEVSVSVIGDSPAQPFFN